MVLLCHFVIKRDIMTNQIYEIEGRVFRTQSDYARAIHDKKIIDALRNRTNWSNETEVNKLLQELKSGKYKFMTLLGEDFLEEVQKKASNPKTISRSGKLQKKDSKSEVVSESIEASAKEVLRKQEKRRKQMVFICSFVAILSIGYFGIYSWQHYRTQNDYEELQELKEKPVIFENVTEEDGPLFHLDGPAEEKKILDEYKNLLIKNKRLIGWVKIADTNIDYPVVQTVDNEYYLDHNLNQEYDKNGSIFMDKDCDVIKPSTNYIIYGHHMKNGSMFGTLDKYQKKEYWEKHPTILFDTIYEKGEYEVMYVFRSRVYSEEDVVFKYYQFIDAGSALEFDSNMREMASVSLYDTGVTAEFGDQLLTLSTCDYQEKNGRFVVVAKKIKE